MKATRVHTQEIKVTICPVCKETVTGELTVEVYLGPVTVGDVVPGMFGGDGAPTPKVEVSTRLRSLVFEHRCPPNLNINVLDEEPEDSGAQ